MNLSQTKVDATQSLVAYLEKIVYNLVYNL